MECADLTGEDLKKTSLELPAPKLDWRPLERDNDATTFKIKTNGENFFMHFSTI